MKKVCNHKVSRVKLAVLCILPLVFILYIAWISVFQVRYNKLKIIWGKVSAKQKIESNIKNCDMMISISLYKHNKMQNLCYVKPKSSSRNFLVLSMWNIIILILFLILHRVVALDSMGQDQILATSVKEKKDKPIYKIKIKMNNPPHKLFMW
mgnify:CR=1 FL=1